MQAMFPPLVYFNKLAASKQPTVKVKKSEPLLHVAPLSHSQQQHVVLSFNPPSAWETWLVVL